MLEFEEVSKNVQLLETKLVELGNSLNISKLEEKLKELEEQTMIPDFWNNIEKSSIILKQINNLKLKTEEYKKANNNIKDIIELIEILKLEPENALENELITSIKKVEKDIEKLEINILLSGKYDINNAIITLHPRSRRNWKLRLGTNVI